MFGKREVLFCAVALATLLVVQAKTLRMEREEDLCAKNLSQACPGAADEIPFAYAPNRQEIDESCTVASTHFPCFEKYAEACDPEDVESRYLLTYLDVCNKESHLYEGLRKSVKCMKIAEKRYDETNCVKDMDKLEAELAAFKSKISDNGISAEDFEKIDNGLTTLQEMNCYLARIQDCDKEENSDSYDTVKEMFNRVVEKQTIFLVDNPGKVDTVLDNLALDDEQKKSLRGKN